MHDLIFVSLEDWDDIWRRNQFLCAEMMRRHPQMRILFVNLPQNPIKRILRGQFHSVFSGSTHSLPDYPRIIATHACEIFPNRFAWGRKFNEWMARNHVRKHIAGLGFENPILWLNPHDSVHMAGRLGESLAIYDITDDWAQMTQSAEKKALTLKHDAELCQKADAVIVCSQALFERKQTLCRNLHLVPNGVDASHYQSVSEPVDGASLPWPRPVLGYTGTLHSDRIDCALLREVADSLSSGSIVMVGPNHLEQHDLDLLRHPRIFLPGSVSYARIPECMRAFDICIVPHRITPFTESLNPIKLWEYLAAGKPIISTRVAGFRDFPHLIHLANDVAEFLALIPKSLEEPARLRDERQREAARHSWTERLDHVEAIIADCLAPVSEISTIA